VVDSSAFIWQLLFVDFLVQKNAFKGNIFLPACLVCVFESSKRSNPLSLQNKRRFPLTKGFLIRFARTDFYEYNTRNLVNSFKIIKFDKLIGL